MNWFREAWDALKCLLTRMMDSTDAQADSVVICGIGAVASLAFLQLISIIFNLAFDAQSYGIGAAAIVGAIGGGVGFKTLAKGRTAPRAPNGDIIQ